VDIIAPWEPWEERLLATIGPGTEEEVSVANTIRDIRIATSSSTRKGIAGLGGAIHDTLGITTGRGSIIYSVALGPRNEQNPYTAELVAMAMAMKRLPQCLVRRQITIITSNQGTLLATSHQDINQGKAALNRPTRQVVC